MTLTGDGEDPTALKTSTVAGVTARTAVRVELTVMVTGIWTAVPVLGVKVITPEYVPTARPTADAPMEMLAGVVLPSEGVMVSHDTLLDDVQATDASVDVSETDCAVARPPGEALNARLAGEATSVLDGATLLLTFTLL